MNRTLRRPMFRMGGSAEGITSGLQAPKRGRVDGPGSYAGKTTKERLLEAMGQQPQGRNFNDFLINMGLDLVSRPKGGNIFQQVATSAKEPYSKFAAANQAEQNLLRQVGLEAGTMDITSEKAAAAAAAKEAGLDRRLGEKIQAEKDLYKLQKGEEFGALIKQRAQESIAEGKFNNYNAATNEATWTYKTSEKYKDRVIGGVLSEKQISDAKTQAKFAKNQGKNNGVGKIYYDPYNDRVLEIFHDKVENKYVLRPVDGTESVATDTTDTTDTTGVASMTIEDATMEATKRGLKIMPERPADAGRGWLPNMERNGYITIKGIQELIEREKSADQLRILSERMRNKTRLR